MKTSIIVDSTADLTKEYRERVHVVPLTVHFGDEEYVDGVTMDKKEFYNRLIESDVLPTTRQATPDAFMKEFDKAKEAKKSKINIFAAIGLFIKQIIAELRKVLTPTRKSLFYWFIAVLIFVVLLMVAITALDFGLGKLVFLIFG